MGFTPDDPRKPAFAEHITELQRSLLQSHQPGAQRHFIYHEVIQGLYRLDDIDGMIEYCYRELDEWPALGEELRKDDPEGLLPPVIACRDRLVNALLRREDFEGADQAAKLLVERRLVDDPEEADLLRQDIKTQRLQCKILTALGHHEFTSAEDALRELMGLEADSSAETLKWFANRCLEAGDERRALIALRAAMDVDPLIKGVKSEVRRLDRKLGVEVGE